MTKQMLAMFIFIFGLFLPLSHVSAGTIVSPYQYAWSNNVGYINFANLTVHDSALSGYAWSTNSGFIKFNPAQGGVLNNGTGNLSGSAWGEQLGWIDFNTVSIGSDGKFSGTATGTLVGTITFDCPNYCDVRTDWRPAATPSVTVSSGAGGGGGSIARAPASIPTPTPTVIPIEPARNPVKSAQAKQQDPNQDGAINILDFNALMVNWGSRASGNSADMNRDGLVDIFDFNRLMVLWGATYQL